MGALSRLVLYGEPTELDAYLRPAARAIQAVVAVPATLALLWLQWWWWVPVPVLVSVGVFELIFWRRGDRPTKLVLASDGIELLDPVREQRMAVDLAKVELATASWRRTDLGPRVVVLLAEPAGPCLALRFAVPDLDIGPHDVDIDEMDALLGGQAGVLKSVAPFDAVARQSFTGMQGLAWLRETIPPPAWTRHGVRLWRGVAPPLSPFGFHFGDPSLWLVLEGTRWSTRRPSDGQVLDEGILSSVTLYGAVRSAMLVVHGEEGLDRAEAEVPLIGLQLAEGLRIWFSAPLAAATASSVELHRTDLHCHPAEGAALVHHLRKTLPPDALPPPLVASAAALATGGYHASPRPSLP